MMASEKEKSTRKDVAPCANPAPEGSGNEIQRQRSLNGRTTGPTRRSTKGQWTQEEDAILYKAVQRFKGRNWKKIAECFPDRTDVQCLHRWQKVLNPDLVKGPWSKEEDDKIIEMVNKYGPKKWSTIAKALPGRIGKQCRERWHNHLNPSINKEAWTQEEEIVLIHAHQIYGNKWAELTKFLPGRTDNAIKNHWNSSVKKKLHTYLASGLLEEFKGLPQLENPTHYITSSAVVQQNIEDRHEVEDSSECSQSSSVQIVCSHSDCDLVNTFSMHEDLKLGDDTNQKDVQDSCLSVCMKYYASLEEIACAVPETKSGVSDSANILPEVELSERNADQVGSHELTTNFPPEDLQESDYHSLSMRDHDLGNISLPYSSEIEIPNSLPNIDPGYEKRDKFIVPHADCFNGKYFETEMHEETSFGSLTAAPNMVDLDYSSGVSSQPVYNSEVCGTMASHYLPIHPVSSSGRLGVSHCQSLKTLLPLSYLDSDEVKSYISNNAEMKEKSAGTQDSEVITCSYDGFAYLSRSASCPSDINRPKVISHEDGQEIGTPERTYAGMMVSSSPNAYQKDASPSEKLARHRKEQQDHGALFYEPPCFPSLEIPFVSCDLISPSGDLKQAYSPLGIRQLMIPSLNCSTSYSLWDSPSRDNSPDAILKTAAKSFICTPSIMKKRQRELLSPAQERRNDKKFGLDINRGLFDLDSTNATEKSFMVTSNEIQCSKYSSFMEGCALSPSDTREEKLEHFMQNKENVCPISCANDGNNTIASTSQSRAQTESFPTAENSATEVNAGVTGRRPLKILAEHSPNDLQLSSPGGHPASQPMETAAKSSKSRYLNTLEAAPKYGQTGSRPESDASALLSPADSGSKKDESSVAITSTQSATLPYPSQIMVENCGSSIDMELGSINIFADTPSIKRGLESPSAWKSPWFMNSLLPGHWISTDIMYEDIGYLMSPGDRTYDAIALMKQLSEHSAAAVADAQEVLRSGSHETKSDERQTKNEKFVEADEDVEVHHIQPKIMAEARVLDFSGCASPVRKTEYTKVGNTGTSSTFSSPSAFLMKGCR